MLLPSGSRGPQGGWVHPAPFSLWRLSCGRSHPGGSRELLLKSAQRSDIPEDGQHFSVVSDGFPGGSAGKESACNVGDLGSSPGLGRSPGEGNSSPFQCSGLENPMDCRGHGVPKSQNRLSDFDFPLTLRPLAAPHTSFPQKGNSQGHPVRAMVLLLEVPVRTVYRLLHKVPRRAN